MPEVDRTLSSALLLETKTNQEPPFFRHDFNLKRHYNEIYTLKELSLSLSTLFFSEEMSDDTIFLNRTYISF